MVCHVPLTTQSLPNVPLTTQSVKGLNCTKLMLRARPVNFYTLALALCAQAHCTELLGCLRHCYVFVKEH